MHFLRALIDEEDATRRTAMLSGKGRAKSLVNGNLESLSRETSLPVEALMIAISKEIAFVAEGIILGLKYPGTPDNEQRSLTIVETLIKRRAMTAPDERDPMIEAALPGKMSVMAGAINAGVSKIAAERAILRLVYSGRYHSIPNGEIVPSSSK